MTGDPVSLESAHGRARVYPTGALLTEVSLKLGDGRWVTPLAEAPWAGVPQPPEIPPHLHRLGGEFFCLPFGGGGTAVDPAPGYEAIAAGPVDCPLHGPAANATWEIVAHDPSSVTLALDLPQPFAVARLLRTIRIAADAPAIESRVLVQARRKARVPAAFHPILRLPQTPRALQTEAGFAQGLTYPATLVPDRMLSRPGARFAALDRIPGRHGGMADLSLVPPGGIVEDVVLMAGMHGPVRAHFRDEAFALVIDWSREHLPHCMLWLHDRALEDPPWCGRFRGLGVEPMAACFDGPWGLSVGDNPLEREGYSTALNVDPSQDIEVWCRLSVESE
jgi:hypothetical protein